MTRLLPAFLLTALLAFACGSEPGGQGPVDVCRCAPDQVCVNNTCVDPTDPIIDPNGEDAPVCVTGDVRINEVRTSSADLPDFIELIGAPGTALDGFLLLGTDIAGAPRTSVRLTGTIGETGLWIGAFGDGLETTPDSIVGLLGFSADGGNIEIFDCEDNRLDALSYGDFEEPAQVRGEGTAIARPAQGDAVGRCIGSDLSAIDTNDNLNDFYAGVATPGTHNDSLEPFCRGCDPTLLQGRFGFSEVLYDPVGVDEDSRAWVELSGEPFAPLAAVILETWDDTTETWTHVRALTSQTIGSDGFLLFTDDAEVPPFGSLQHVAMDGPNDAGGFRLLCDGTVLSAVYWGAVDPDALGVDASEIAPDVEEGHVLARCPDPLTGSFVDAAMATPRAANICP